MRSSRKLEKLVVDCITEHQNNVYRLAYSYVKNKEDALDIVQDAIHKAFISMDQLQDTNSVKSWFYRIVVTTSLDFLRKQKKTQVMEDDILESLIPGAEDTYHNIDLAASLDELPPKYRTVIMLRYFEDMKIEDIAAVMEENANTIKTRLYHGLKKLRVHLEEYDEYKKEVFHHE